MKNINRYVTWKYADNWRDIGLELDLDDNALFSIAFNHEDIKAKFQIMIIYWIERGVDATWKALEVALTNVNRRKLGLYPVDDVYGMITHLLHLCIQHPPL